MHALTDTVLGLAGSPWLYLVLALVAWFDSVLPVLPSELLMIGSGAAAAQGEVSLALLMVAGTVGATAGDHTGYLLGRAQRRRVAAWARGTGRASRAIAWAHRTVADHGAVVLFAARHVPVGRVAATVTMGSTAYPLRRFSPVDVAASAFWAAYSSLLGYVGGEALRRFPERGILVTAAIAVLVVIAVVVHRRRRVRGGSPPAGSPRTR